MGGIKPKGFDRDRQVILRTLPGAKVLDINSFILEQPQHNETLSVTLMVGSNDCAPGANLGRIEDDIVSLLNSARIFFPNARIVYALPLLRKGAIGRRYNENIHELNKCIINLCRSFQFTYIDTSKHFTTNDGYPKVDLYHDLVHLNNKGTSVLVNVLRSFILPKG